MTKHTTRVSPELVLDPGLAAALEDASHSLGDLEGIERAPSIEAHARRVLDSVSWRQFRRTLSDAWHTVDHVVLRGVPAPEDGGPFVLLLATLFDTLVRFRDNRVARHFRMSPWTTALSHTLRPGVFHTDFSVTPASPDVTAIHCKRTDPARGKGEIRVARIHDLLEELRRAGRSSTTHFLTNVAVTLAAPGAAASWVGRLAESSGIRFHPETLTTGARRSGQSLEELQPHLDAIEAAAHAVSFEIHLDAGDALLLSNRKSLHCRGACTVVFQKYPTEYISREVYVAHARGELNA